jgi:putative flippase GtrA
MEFLLSPKGIVIRYLISGGTSTSVDLALLYIFTEYFRMGNNISVALAFIFAFVVSYFMQKYWTFQDGNTDGMHKQAAAYFGVAVFNLFFNSFLVYLFTEKIGFWVLYSQIITSLIIAVSSFFIYRRFIFTKDTNFNSKE